VEVRRGASTGLDAKGAQVTVDPTNLVSAERSFSCDGALLRMRNGCPETIFIQLDPVQDTRATRCVVIRYDPLRFVERSRAYGDLLGKMDEILRSNGSRVEKGHFTKQMRSVDLRDVPSALLDVDIEFVTASNRGFIEFLVAEPSSIRRLASGGSKIKFNAELAVTMPLPALADLLNEWKTMADQLGTHP
jgi:hypothetical protein